MGLLECQQGPVSVGIIFFSKDQMDRRDAADPRVTVLGLGWLPCPALLGLVQGSRATGSGVCGKVASDILTGQFDSAAPWTPGCSVGLGSTGAGGCSHQTSAVSLTGPSVVACSTEVLSDLTVVLS